MPRIASHLTKLLKFLLTRRALSAVALLGSALGGVALSGADFRASTLNPMSGFAAASDFGDLATALTNPGSPLTGTVSLSATASETIYGVASVEIQRATAGGSVWTPVCTATTAPYGCSLNTAPLADGLYDLRSVATSNGGGTKASTVVAGRRVDNNPPTVTMNDPGAWVGGIKTLSADAADGAGAGVTSVRIQRSATGANSWTDVCTDIGAPYSCSFDTTFLTNGGGYDFRAIAVDGVSLSATSTVVSNRRIDNAAPAASLTDPGSPLTGTITLSATGSDTDSGVASVTTQRSPAGAGTWSNVCTDTTSPYSCTDDTASVADGLYDYRAVAVDGAGNSATSVARTNRRLDNTAPSIVLNDPGAWLRGTPTLSTTASDGGSGMANVRVQRSPAGTSTWTDICTDATSPYSCAFATTGFADGTSFDLRAIATDNVGLTATSLVVSNRRIDNGLPTGVGLTDPGSPLMGTVTFSGAAADATSGIASVRFQYLWAGLLWLNMCTATTAPYSCAADTTSIADGSYSMRALATDAAGNATASATQTSRVVDNDPPTVTMGDPGANISGTVSLTATASDAGSGVNNVVIQRSPAGAGAWADVCADTTSPYSCTLDTKTVPEGLYDFRAIATGNVARSTTSAVVASRRVDNTLPAVSLSDPGAYLRGAVTLTATASDGGGSGMASVAFQRSPAGASTWTTICTDTTSPYSCAWTTTGVADGQYDLRAIATDGAGNQTTSGAVTGRNVDNTAPTAADVQTANGGSTAGVAQSGDSMTFTYSEVMSPSTILAGWDGTAAPVTVRLTDGATDRLQVWNAANTALVNLTAASGANATVDLAGDYVPASGATFSGTMVQAGSSVTVTLAGLTAGGVNPGPAAGGTVMWGPSLLSTDVAGNACGGAVRSELGLADSEF